MQAEVWQYYSDFGRDLPWRQAEPDGQYDAYKIMVSEMMLQQTQVSRVIPKYEVFIERFPTVSALANAPLATVLETWSGLGYNRRAKYLHQAAKELAKQNAFPTTLTELVGLPGVGHNTAAAILAYAFNQPIVFIETNIRTVYIHHFFNDQSGIDDKQLLPLIEDTLDRQRPREWYWALMDYGSHLKSVVGNSSRQSKHYAKQSAFQGSRRQIRGQVIRQLTQGPRSFADLTTTIVDERLQAVLADLLKEGLIIGQPNGYRLAS